MEGGRAQVEVDKAGAGDLDLVHHRAVAERVDDAGRDVAGTLAGGFCQAHGHVAREVTVTGVARALNGALDREIGGGIGKFRQAGESGLDEFGDDLFHGAH